MCDFLLRKKTAYELCSVIPQMSSGKSGGGGARDSRERLIDEVRRYPVLYDTRHEQHRDIDARDRCWNEIAERLQANSEVLKREWKILRDSLRQALSRKAYGALTKGGAPAKRWRYQQRMAFVLPYMTKRLSRSAGRDEIKVGSSEPEAEAGEAAGEAMEGVEEWGVGGGCTDALELFFAAVCAGARRLPAPDQRWLRTQVLEALLQAERRAEGAPDTKPAPAHPL